jgi:hypothetical protein
MKRLTTPEVRACINQEAFLTLLDGTVMEGRLTDVVCREMYLQEMGKEDLTKVSLKDIYKYHFESSEIPEEIDPAKLSIETRIDKAVSALDTAVVEFRKTLLKIATILKSAVSEEQ